MSDILRHQLCRKLWTLDFFDVNTNWQASDLFDQALEFVHTCTTTADHHTSFCCVNRHSDEVCASFDLNTTDSWARFEPFLDEFTDLNIFRQPLGKIFFTSEPT